MRYNTRMHICMYSCEYVCVFEYLHGCMHMFMYIHVCANVCIYTTYTCIRKIFRDKLFMQEKAREDQLDLGSQSRYSIKSSRPKVFRHRLAIYMRMRDVCIYLCIFYMCMYAWILHAYIHVNVCKYVYRCTDACLFVFVYMYACMHVCLCTHL